MTISATAKGTLDGYPSNVSDPGAPIMSFSTLYNASSAATLTLCKSGNCAGKDITLTTHGANAQVLITVSGYYVLPVTAIIGANGAGNGDQLVSSKRDSTGVYTVEFNTWLTGCAIEVTVGDYLDPPDNTPVPQGYATARTVHLLGGVPEVGVEVHTFNHSGEPADLPFRMNVTC